MQNKKYDYVGLAGSTKSLETILGQIDISKRLHQIKEAVLVHHEDCGAYGAESTRDRHAKDLLHAKKTITDKYSDIKVSLFYLHLDGTFESVE